MNITIAVALITACSTLAGGAIASITTILVQGKQLRNQADQAAAERTDQNFDKHREFRRKAYADFLSKVDAVEREIVNCWKDSELTEDKLAAAHATFRSLDAPANIVYMEGPQIVGLAAMTTRLVLQEELIRVHKLFEKSKDNTVPMIENRDDEYGESFGRRLKIRWEFADAAREILEGAPVSPRD